MRLMRIGAAGSERPVVRVDDAHYVDVSDQLTAEAVRALGCENGLGAAETVLREGLLRLGGGMLGELLSADRGHRGPRIPCGNGHQAEFTGCRDKTFDTVLGRSPRPAPGTTARRASTASPRVTPSSASRARPCPRGFPR